ncbi:hypothetical protein ICN42_10515 [Polynucleobacter sp. 71A-WALBACH]|uniref:hypothetical protein n=1 Tax=Polynucleobacter sp. 71A-WALBACH TaxID=2689097 RepID=UPI001C0A952E|nr:hypothetical protein [Polynucleobacter sp. 71A-WALBACH]MBU3594523.1 hypothetical protein [Polynucleobacter sp. 71A-WALBACH]
MPSKPNKNLSQTLAAIAELEDQQDLKMADKSMKELRSVRVKAIPIERLIRSIDRKIAIEEALSS